jgi:hypothetical protein
VACTKNGLGRIRLFNVLQWIGRRLSSQKSFGWGLNHHGEGPPRSRWRRAWVGAALWVTICKQRANFSALCHLKVRERGAANHSINRAFIRILAPFSPYSVYADMSPQMILALMCSLEQARTLAILRAEASHHGHEKFQYRPRKSCFCNGHDGRAAQLASFDF